jgi:NAD(P)H-nitrite reductase large subunit
MRHVIVGGGTAAINAITTIREIDKGASDIVLIAQEAPYARMVLPYYLWGTITERQVFTLDQERLARLKVDARLGRRAVALDTAVQRVTLDDGSTVEYDDLLIATGSSAVRPPIPGVDGKNIFNHWVLSDTQGIIPQLRPGASVVIVGAGFIAFTILNALVARGAKLTVVEIMPQVLPRMVDQQSAALVESWLRARGVAVHTNARVTAIADTADGRKRLALAEGEPLVADVVIMATGIKPNLDWLKDAGLRINRGIVVDRQLRSNVPNVYAAGDVAEGPDRITGEPVVHAIEPTAMEHGRIVGAAMAGQPRPYPGSLVMNIVDVLGLEIASFGVWERADGELTVAVNEAVPLYRKYVWKDDRMVGAIMLGPSERVWVTNDMGMIKGLVQAQTPLGPWKAHLQRDPWDVRRPFIATRTTARLLPETLLGRPSQPAEAVLV